VGAQNAVHAHANARAACCRSTARPAEAKAAIVSVAGVALTFRLAWLAVTRTRLGRFL
jgi:hypothetical protein